MSCLLSTRWENKSLISSLEEKAWNTGLFRRTVLSPVSIQTQSLALRALRALRKRKPQETQALVFASSQSWLPLLRPSIPIGWRLRLLRENCNASACVSCSFRLRDCVWMETGLYKDSAWLPMRVTHIGVMSLCSQCHPWAAHHWNTHGMNI